MIHREYRRRLGRAISSLKGVPFPNRTARMKAAQRKIGFFPDEIYGGTLDADAVLFINTSVDAERYLTEAHYTDLPRNEGESPSIFASLATLQISAGTIARTIANADASVKKSARMVRLEDAAERESAAAPKDPTDQRRQDSLRQLLAARSRRRPLKKL